MASPSFGSQLKMDPAGGTVYVAIGDVQDIAGPSVTRGEIDVTTHDSASGFREYIQGLADSGGVTFPIVFDSQNVKHLQGVGTGLLGDFEQTCTIPSWEHTFNDCAGTVVLTYDAFVTGYSFTNAVEGAVMGDITLKVTGKPTLTVT
jgi:hypothetical protein